MPNIYLIQSQTHTKAIAKVSQFLNHAYMRYGILNIRSILQKNAFSGFLTGQIFFSPTSTQPERIQVGLEAIVTHQPSSVPVHGRWNTTRARHRQSVPVTLTVGCAGSEVRDMARQRRKQEMGVGMSLGTRAYHDVEKQGRGLKGAH